MNNNSIVIRPCPICGSKVVINTEVRKYGSYDPHVHIEIKCSNEECDYIKPVTECPDIESAIREWNNRVHRFEQIRVGSQLKGRAEGDL